MTDPGPVPLSWNQKFLCALEGGHAAGALSQWYTVNYGLRLTGQVDDGTLRRALNDVVARHEILRTSLVSDAGRWRQEIHPQATVSLLVRDEPDVPPASRHARAHQLLNEIEARPFSVGEMPLLRSVLVRFGPDDSLLVLTTHHIASDAWSMQVILRDLAACYAVRRENVSRGGLPAACQYRDFARWQRANCDTAFRSARQYWRQNLLDARILALPADRVLSPGTADPYSVHRFVIDAELATTSAGLARTTRSSLFMVLLAAYNVLASRLTGDTDLVVPTFSSGRAEERFSDSVGPYYNLLPIRTDLEGCVSFLDVVSRTRASCLDAYKHDIPFMLIAEDSDLMKPCAEANMEVAAFEMLPPAVVDGQADGITYSQMRDRLCSQPVGASTPRGMLWALDRLPTGEIVGCVRFSRDRFRESTIPNLASRYRDLLGHLTANPSAPV